MNKKKKFFLITTSARSIRFFSGQARLWREYYNVKGIAAEYNGCLKAFSKEEDIETIDIPMHREISLASDLLCLIRFIWLFIKERPYVVHGNSPKGALLSMLSAWITFRPIRIYMCHGLRYQGTRGKLEKILMMMEKITCACATHVVAVSFGLRNKMTEDGLVSRNKIQVIGNGSVSGIDLCKFNTNNVHENARKILRIPKNSFVFTFVGRLVGDKGVNELVSAFDKIQRTHENTYLILVGAEEKNLDPIKESTLRLIKDNRHIIAVGKQTDVKPYIIAADAFVMPSYREGFGLVLTEAAALGIPAITTNILGCNEIIERGKNGDIVEPRDEESLYAKMNEWVENPEYVKTIAANTVPMVRERYDQCKVWNNYLEYYKSFLKL